MFTDEEMAVFFDELDEKVQILNESFLRMENEGGSDEILQEIFRAAHTIKGSSAIIGFDRMSRLTHEMENLFDLMRNQRLGVSKPLMEVLFESLDTLIVLRSGNGDAEVDLEPLLGKLEKCRCNEGVSRPEPEDSAYLKAEEALELPGSANLGNSDAMSQAKREMEKYRVQVTLESDCMMKPVRAFLVIKTLEEAGIIIGGEPSPEDIKEGLFDRSFVLFISSGEDSDTLRNILLAISEVARVEVTPIDGALEAEVAPGSVLAEKGKGVSPVESKKVTQTTVRIDVKKLDALMDLVGELVIDRTRLKSFAQVFGQRYNSDDLAGKIEEITSHLGQITNDLQEQIMKARMLPVSNVFNRFPRMVRDLSQKMGKRINFVVEGNETELDRNVIEVIADPLIHLIRNSIDHGLEFPDQRERAGKSPEGLLKLSAAYLENHIVITVEDDGRGIDPDAVRAKAVEKNIVSQDAAFRTADSDIINYIFEAGFSTAREVSDLSGRGVGLDVVKSKIESINGSVEVANSPGRGTKFTIQLPLTLAIIRSLMVEVDQQVYAIPLANVLETMRISAAEVKMIQSNEFIVVRGKVMPLVRASQLLGGAWESEGSSIYIVILNVANRRVGLVVSNLIGEQEIVIKSLGKYLGRIPYISGATILGDGKVSLILDAREVVRQSGSAEDIVNAS